MLFVLSLAAFWIQIKHLVITEGYFSQASVTGFHISNAEHWRFCCVTWEICIKLPFDYDNIGKVKDGLDLERGFLEFQTIVAIHN